MASVFSRQLVSYCVLIWIKTERCLGLSSLIESEAPVITLSLLSWAWHGTEISVGYGFWMMKDSRME